MSDAFILPEQNPVAYVLPSTRPTALIYPQTRQVALIYTPMGMTTKERRKLAGIEENAQRNREAQVLGVPLADVTDILCEGDSVPFTMTTAFRRLARCFVPAHAMRDQGYLKIVVIGRYTDPSGAGMTVEFRLSSSDDYPRGWGVPSATRGKPPAVTYHDTYDTGPMIGDATERGVALNIEAHACGHVGTTPLHTVDGTIAYSIPAAGARAARVSICRDFATNPLDTTRSKSIWIEARATALGVGQALKILAARVAIMHPADHAEFAG